MKMPVLLLTAMPILFIALAVSAQKVSINNGYEKGVMDGEFKVGKWQYFDSTGTLDLEIDYDKGLMTYLQPDTTDYAIFRDGGWTFSTVDIPPRYIGSWVEFYDILNSNLDYPMQARYRDVVGKVFIAFEVDTLGHMVNLRPVNDIGCECAYECMRVLRLVPNYWLVASRGGVKYRSRFVISCEFGIILDGRRIEARKKKGRRDRQDSPALPLSRELPGISYVIKKGYNPE